MADNAHITALVKAQAAMGKLIKGVENPAFKRDGKAHKYADLAAVLETCANILHDHGFAILQPSNKDEMGQYTDTVLAHESGGQFTTRVYWTGVKPDMQGSGSAMTYARRYGLMALTALAPEDDDGAEASKPAPKREPPPAPVDAGPAGSRDRLLAALGQVVGQKGFTSLTENAKFKADLAALAEAAPPMALQVTAEIGKLRSKLVIDDSLPEFLSTANGEDQQ